MSNSSDSIIPILHYFGANYCPYSNESSMLYNLINNNFREKYDNVIIKIHMIDNPNNNDRERDIIARANISVVPTITTSTYVHCDLTPPSQLSDGDGNEGIELLLKQICYIFISSVLIK